MPGIQTILHPTDFSENSRPAFETACALARDNQATLLVLHVMMPSASPLSGRVAACPIRCSPPNPRKPSRNCPGPNRRTRRFASSIGWPKETPRRRSFACPERSRAT